MAKRQNRLAAVMQNNGIDLWHPVLVDRNIFPESKFHHEINHIYKSLDGILEVYPLGLGDFDIVTDNYFVELDEENHFNSYRKITLQSEIYQEYKYFSVADYMTYCDDMEHKGGKVGNFWTTPKSEEQFGKSSTEKDLSGNGPARWKQRAFYDFLKDIYGILINKPVFRFSIYEKINGVSINTILKKQKNEDVLLKHLSATLNV